MLLVRRISNRKATELLAILLANLDKVDEDLTCGAIVVLGEESIRIRRLPVTSSKEARKLPGAAGGADNEYGEHR